MYVTPGGRAGWRRWRAAAARDSSADTSPDRGVVVTEAGSYLRLTASCITQLEAQGPARTCNESKKEEEEAARDSSAGASPALTISGFRERKNERALLQLETRVLVHHLLSRFHA